MNDFSCTKIRGLANRNSWVEIDEIICRGETTYQVIYATYDRHNRKHSGMKLAKTKDKARKIFEDKCAQYGIY